MNWHKGSIAEAVAESKAKDAIFVVFIEGKDELSAKLERFVDDVRVRSRLETADFVTIKVQGNSSAYGQFMSLYKVVPIPSLFFIGKSGTPLEIATGITESVEELMVKIDKVLVLAGKRTETSSAASLATSFVEELNPTEVRSFAGADDSTSLSKDEAFEETPESQNASESPKSVEVVFTSVPNPSLQVEESKVNQSTAPAFASISSISIESSASNVGETQQATASAKAAASKMDTATTSGNVASNLAASSILPSVPLLSAAVPVAQVQGTAQEQVPEEIAPTDSETRMLEVQNLLEQKRRERLEEEKRQEKENELRRRREGRQAQSQQALAKEQELKNMQERIRRERQEEQEARERIRAQIAADRAEQAHRNQIEAEANSTTTSLAGASTTEPSVYSVDETRLQIRLPGGINHTKSFPVGEVLGTVRIFVRNELLAASDVHDFTLATSYPRREFQKEDEAKTLRELKLVPNAVVLVLAKEHVNRVVRSGSSLVTMLITAIWAMLTPAAKALDYIHKMGLRPLTQRLSAMVANIRGTTDRQDNVGGAVQGDAAARRNMDMFTLRPPPPPGYNYEQPEDIASGSTSTPQPQPGTGSTPQPQPTSSSSQGAGSSQEFQQRPGGYRYGGPNIRRLQDTNKDDEKDKATYNGNSTQQQ
ncbi:UBX domain-containing protein 4 [Drosophila kikkawai]|uniref:UBX domain-containing protein 4 n=1 Tax=Drosophila kikkawai TaxID=30033 RepID=A0A6P4I1Z6_DROKI|nr:UBX domain-containing protein 4 [Drosophila kikkawai]